MAFDHWLGHKFGRRFLRSAIRAGLLFSVLALASWIMGVPLLWPSLGPTTYVLAFDRDKNHPLKNVFGAHAIGAVAGLFAHWVCASDLSLSAIHHPLGITSLHIALSSIVALSLTTGLMRATGWMHSPACATTLILALGLITGPIGIVYVLTAVILVYLTHFLNERLFESIGWIDKQDQ